MTTPLSTSPEGPGPGIGPGTHSHHVPGTLAIPRSTAALVVVTLFVVLGGLTWLLIDARGTVAAARGTVAAAQQAATDSEEVVREIRGQSGRNELLITEGIRCLRENQRIIVANQRVPIGPERAELGNEFCQRFLETANDGG